VVSKKRLTFVADLRPKPVQIDQAAGVAAEKTVLVLFHF